MTHHSPKHRQSSRLSDYDYAQAGGYFFTVVTYGRTTWFGRICSGEMQLNAVGQMICREWQALPGRFPGLELYAFVIMPNHVHGIILLNPIDDAAIDRTSEHYQVFSKPTAVDENTGAAREDQLPRVTPGSLGAIIRAFKSSTSMRFHRMRDGDPGPLWQRNYYDRIIRNMREFEMIRAYILANPTTWENDQANPNNCYP